MTHRRCQQRNDSHEYTCTTACVTSISGGYRIESLICMYVSRNIEISIRRTECVLLSISWHPRVLFLTLSESFGVSNIVSIVVSTSFLADRYRFELDSHTYSISGTTRAY